MTPEADIPSARTAFLTKLDTARRHHETQPAPDTNPHTIRNALQWLVGLGCLTAPLDTRYGGLGLGTGPDAPLETLTTLRQIGRMNLSFGRWIEGHINVLRLVAQYGSPAQNQSLAHLVQKGALTGIWVTDSQTPVILHATETGLHLSGRKGFASAIHFVSHALITARTDSQTPDAPSLMLLVPVGDPSRIRPGPGSLSGMSLSDTGAYDFTNLPVPPEAIIGTANDYLRQPEFSAGAWRGSAVTLGGMDRILDLFRTELHQRKRDTNPHQQARIGHALIARETAALWVQRAALIAQTDTTPGDITALVNLARIAVEHTALDLITLVQRGLGLSAFLRTNPIETTLQDLATYLRQPAPDETLTEAAAWFTLRDPPAPTAYTRP